MVSYTGSGRIWILSWTCHQQSGLLRQSRDTRHPGFRKDWDGKVVLGGWEAVYFWRCDLSSRQKGCRPRRNVPPQTATSIMSIVKGLPPAVASLNPNLRQLPGVFRKLSLLSTTKHTKTCEISKCCCVLNVSRISNLVGQVKPAMVSLELVS